MAYDPQLRGNNKFNVLYNLRINLEIKIEFKQSSALKAVLGITVSALSDFISTLEGLQCIFSYLQVKIYELSYI